MPKYNTPRDSDLVHIVKDIMERLGRLSNASRVTLVPIDPVKATDYTPVAVTSGSFVDTHVFPIVVLAARPVVRILATCTDGTTSGEFRLTNNNGDPLTDVNNAAVAPEVIPVGTTFETQFETDQIPSYSLANLSVGADYIIKLQARRTAGAGTVNIKAKYLVQLPS